MIVRQEKPADYDEVYDMVKRSFATTDFSDSTEADYLTKLRKKSCFIPELSLVAVDDSVIVGQIVLYRMQIDCTDKTEEQLVLFPLSVHPNFFKPGRFRVDAITDFVVEYLENYSDSKPFCMMLSFLEPHWQNDMHTHSCPVGAEKAFEDYDSAFRLL